MANDANTFDEPASLRRKISKLKMQGCLWMVMLYNSLIYIMFEFDRDKIFGIALFEISHVGNAMEEGEIIYSPSGFSKPQPGIYR